MRRLLVTGSSGQVGGAVAALVEAVGWSVRRFDLTDGEDLRDAAATRRAPAAPIVGHVRMTLCGPGPFDTTVARRTMRWRPRRAWRHRT